MVSKVSGLRGVADAAFREALLAADPEEAVYRHLRLKRNLLRVGDVDYFLSKFKRVFLIGAGKASVRMAHAVERILGDHITGGIIITNPGQPGRLRKTLIRECGHPVPDEKGIKATEELLDYLDDLDDHDLVICVLSGGGSALLTAPVDGISLSDLQEATNLFLSSGMTIREINTVRKHISKVKGGKLAKKVFPATVISLTLSDVIGDYLDVIASGPFAPDPTTFSDSIKILKNRRIWDRMPDSIKTPLMEGEAGNFPETPKSKDKIFKKVHNQIVGSNELSLMGAEFRAHRLGMNTMILSSSISGESREIAHYYSAIAREIRKYRRPVEPPCCIIAGGETTVRVRGDGKGGRCQELALSVAMDIQDISGCVFLAAGTDGIDGPTDAAGAIVDSNTIEKALKSGLVPEQYIRDNNSFEFFEQMNELIKTGPTGTNVMDIHLLFVG
jgi:glycerate 2-kinase